MEYEFCPNCKQKIIPSGFFGINRLVTKDIDFINSYSGKNSPAYCESCISIEYSMAKAGYNEEVEKLRKIQTDSLQVMPCINIQATNVWEYEILSIVTAQTTMGTGFLSELSSDWNDFWGQESGTMNKKISKGEQVCLNMMRIKALSLGGNAVIGVDIDYSEVGSLRGMILVCSTGTAIRIKNLDVFDEKTRSTLTLLNETTFKMKKLNDYIEALNPKF